MREIKFRALLSFGYLPYQWIYYGALEVPKEISEADEIIAKNLQFTGLLDKNGKEVYEGDILTYEFEAEDGKRRIYEEVFWDKRMACFSFRIYGPHLDQQGRYGGGVCAIISGKKLDTDGIVCGNIWENPDLIS